MTPYEAMKAKLGLQENHNRTALMAWFKQFKINLDPSTTPWCSAAMNAAVREAGGKGTGLMNARSWLDYGTKIDEEDAQEGDIIIFARGNNNWQGHITFFVEWDDANNRVKCLGGNQSDSICYTWYGQDAILGMRRL